VQAERVVRRASLWRTCQDAVLLPLTGVLSRSGAAPRHADCQSHTGLVPAERGNKPAWRLLLELVLAHDTLQST
jgi:hypothetical protein